MNAFLEIIQRLVEAITPQTWLEFSHFPFKNLAEPESKVFDICMFECNAQGALGFLWIEFKDTECLYLLPFQLSRYKEDADLISILPWSLRDASSDYNFFSSWRSIQRNKNPLYTMKGGTLFHKKAQGDPSFTAIGVSSDTNSTSVRIDFQILYKIYRLVDPKIIQSPEVELLSYLANQSVFSNYPKIISVFEYSCLNINRSHTAIGYKYIQNNGSLFPYFISLLHTARFSSDFRERTAKDAWEKILQLAEKLGRIMGDFHRAMSLAPKSSDLHPAPLSQEKKDSWIKIISEKLEERLCELEKLIGFYPDYSGLFFLLRTKSKKYFDDFLNMTDFGLHIRIHGNMHLGQLYIGQDDLYLVDYNADNLQSLDYQKIKQPCLKDVAALLGSFRFAWYFTEKKFYEDISNSEDSIQIFSSIKQKHSSRLQNVATLLEIESLFMKFYNNTLDENLNAEELRPKNPKEFHDLLQFFLFMKYIKEIGRENKHPNPRSKVWFQVLQEFMTQV